MSNKMKFLCCCFAVLSVFVFTPGKASATNVGLELVLLADVSGSLDGTDFALQRDGYVAAFKDPAVQSAIASIPGGIAVTLVYWSTNQYQSVGWAQITDAASSVAFANAIFAAARPESGITGMAAAMNYAGGLFTNNFESTKQIVDVSGDGANQDGLQVDPSVQAARDNLVNNFGVDMINALWIDDRNYFGDDPEDLVKAVPYGITNVIYGTGSFSWIVQDFEGFETAVKDKIYTEIVGTPEPLSMLLLGLGLIGVAGIRRKYRN